VICSLLAFALMLLLVRLLRRLISLACWHLA